MAFSLHRLYQAQRVRAHPLQRSTRTANHGPSPAISLAKSHQQLEKFPLQVQSDLMPITRPHASCCSMRSSLLRLPLHNVDERTSDQP